MARMEKSFHRGISPLSLIMQSGQLIKVIKAFIRTAQYRFVLPRHKNSIQFKKKKKKHSQSLSLAFPYIADVWKYQGEIFSVSKNM